MSIETSPPVWREGVTEAEMKANEPRNTRLEFFFAFMVGLSALTITTWIIVDICMGLIWHQYAWTFNVLLILLGLMALGASSYICQIGWGAFRWTQLYAATKDTNWFLRWEEAKSQDYISGAGVVREWRQVQHFVIVTAYKEPVEILRLIAYTLMSQRPNVSFCRRQITLVFAMEEREGPAAEAKVNDLKTELMQYFRDVLGTYHPPGLEGDIPGKASNFKWAVKEVEQYIQGREALKAEDCLIHVADADSLYDPNYFSNVTYKWCVDPNREFMVFQPCMIPTCNFWELPAPIRQLNTNIAAQEMMSAVDPREFQIPFSTYGLALSTLQKIGGTGSAGNAQDGDVIAEDHHMFIKGFFATDLKLTVQPIILPCLNYSVGGERHQLCRNLNDRFTQAKRHMFGVSEMFYLWALFCRGRCCNRKYTAFGQVRKFNLFIKMLKIHSIPYLGLWIAMGLAFLFLLKAQKSACQRGDEAKLHPDVCDEIISEVTESWGAIIFSLTTTLSALGGLFVVIAFTRMLHATHHTLVNIADPHGAFMRTNVFDVQLTSTSSGTSPTAGTPSFATSETRQMYTNPPLVSRAGEPTFRNVPVAAGFPWFGTVLQLVVECLLFSLPTSLYLGTIPAIWGLYKLITGGHRMAYVTAPKPQGSGAEEDDASHVAGDSGGLEVPMLLQAGDTENGTAQNPVFGDI